MTYLTLHRYDDNAREALIAWLESDGVNPAEVVDDGKFGIYNGTITGRKFVFGADGEKIIYKGKVVTVPFRHGIRNPLPEGLS